MGSLPEGKMLSADCINRINRKILEDNRNVKNDINGNNEYAIPDSKQKSDDYEDNETGN